LLELFLKLLWLALCTFLNSGGVVSVSKLVFRLGNRSNAVFEVDL
jgi:hypothetical protein